MKIGIDASRAQIKERTGTENYSRNLILALSKIDSKNNYRLYLHRPDNEFENLPKNFEKKIIGLPRLWTQIGLAWDVFKKPPDLLFIPAHTLPVIRRPNLKTVVTIHDLGAEFLPGYHALGGREYLLFSTRYAVKNATALIAVSCATKKDLIEKLGADPAKIFVVYEGVDHQIFKPQIEKEIEKVKAKYKISGDYFLFVGTIQPRKNLVKLIEAFSMVVGQLGNWAIRKKNPKHSVAQKPNNLQLVIAGKKGWLADEIYQAPKKFKVEERVKFLDYVDVSDLPALYSGCLAFVLPSLVEGFGLPALEAMACGAPVMLSKVTSLPEIGGNAAFYIVPDNSEKLAEYMMELLNPNMKRKLSALSIAQAKKFSWEKCAKETLKVYISRSPSR
jgi:glycosyltransferase involved in cell wall biosynthesis